ncbi:hypothetical protein L195_g018844 [Trifolium pratense]|uniref:Uncharacterized protein n=1 Tax=Trifolium pratense TaxID=57577 RepID=A0A2K3MXX8_TRIPR|nr:hypothetical protein L195_g018844 [Trifolium pratense]
MSSQKATDNEAKYKAVAHGCFDRNVDMSGMKLQPLFTEKGWDSN